MYNPSFDSNYLLYVFWFSLLIRVSYSHGSHVPVTSDAWVGGFAQDPNTSGSILQKWLQTISTYRKEHAKNNGVGKIVNVENHCNHKNNDFPVGP